MAQIIWLLEETVRAIHQPQDEKYLTFLQLAQGSLTEEQLADWIRMRI